MSDTIKDCEECENSGWAPVDTGAGVPTAYGPCGCGREPVDDWPPQLKRARPDLFAHAD